MGALTLLELLSTMFTLQLVRVSSTYIYPQGGSMMCVDNMMYSDDGGGRIGPAAAAAPTSVGSDGACSAPLLTLGDAAVLGKNAVFIDLTLGC